MEKRGKVDQLSNLDNIIKRVEQNYSVFGNKELRRVLSAYTKDPDVIHSVCEEIKLLPTVMLLGIGEDSEEKYTTKRLFELENTIQLGTDNLLRRHSKPMPQSFIKEQLSVYENLHQLKLTKEQRNAVNHLMNPERISCVVGRAGSGKSFTLGAARHVWEKKGIQVQGITLSGIAAVNLQKESNIQSRTIASFKYAILSYQLKLNKNDVVVMDEAGMTDSESMAYILEEIQKAKAKIVLVGDPDQLQPIGSGPIFQAILQRTGFAEINRIYRQAENWQRKATKSLSLGKIHDALEAYDKHNCIHFDESLILAKKSIVNRWSELRKENQLSELLILAHRNADVGKLNQRIRKQRINLREIDAGELIQTEKAIINLSKHDRILFTKNNKKMNVKNGQFGTVTLITGNNISVKTDAGKMVSFDTALYPYFTHGYAATVHKAQGVTVKHSMVFVAGFHWDRHLSYVALSRHKKSCHVFTDKQSYGNVEKLSNQLGRKPLKDSVVISEKIEVTYETIVPRKEKLIDLLKNYADYQVEQKKLIRLIGTTKFNALEESKKHHSQYRQNKENIKNCIQKIAQHPDIHKNLAVMENTKAIKLSERGGFEAISQRIGNNQIEAEVQAVIMDIHGKVLHLQAKIQ
jgi:Ti-type conjugative transfer relaxase TraA